MSLNGAKGLRKVIGNRNSRITIVYHIFHKGYTWKGVAFLFMVHYRELQVDRLCFGGKSFPFGKVEETFCQ